MAIELMPSSVGELMLLDNPTEHAYGYFTYVNKHTGEKFTVNDLQIIAVNGDINEYWIITNGVRH